MDLGKGPRMRSAAYAHLCNIASKTPSHVFLNFRAALNGPVKRFQDAIRGLCGDDDDNDDDGDDDDRHHHQPTHQTHDHIFL